ncbi:hypothetical protein G9C98_000422 [Cotesia typhae]|uniref:Chitin-binding type-2 domain-containing protein n=1 Tax=Cotesia typhae TaxID=2053667 RepID=A0A8J5VAZ0_9HYME|nr:hypothetical protein G9C98_000422 [Cotesia typhae]
MSPHIQRFDDFRQNNLDFNKPSPFVGQSFSRSAQQSSGLCPERTGRFPVPNQCDAYIECIDGEGEQKFCPEGLLFNPDARFNYPCGYPIDITCEGRPNLQPAQPTDDCPHQYGYFKVGQSAADCGQFMNCAGGVGYMFNCPEVSEPVRFFRSPNDCQRYFICVNGKPRLQNCGEGNAFNELINACDAAENVTGCEPPFIPEQEEEEEEEEEPLRFQAPKRFNTGPQAAQKGRVRLF